MSQSRGNLFPVPAGFQDLLRDLSLCVIRDQPDDLLLYAKMYFESKWNDKPFKFEGPRRTASIEEEKRKMRELLYLLEPRELIQENLQGTNLNLDFQMPQMKAIRPKQEIHKDQLNLTKYLSPQQLSGELQLVSSNRSLALSQDWKENNGDLNSFISNAASNRQKDNQNITKMSLNLTSDTSKKDHLAIEEPFVQQLAEILNENAFAVKNKLIDTDNDIPEIKVKKNLDILYQKEMIYLNDSISPEISMLESNYNISENIKQQLIGAGTEKLYSQQLIPSAQKPGQQQQLSSELKISVVKSTKLGAYQKGHIYVNIMSARNLPSCSNATCEVFLEGLEDQRITSHTLLETKNPDWYYLRKKLVILIPKDFFQEKSKANPFFLRANIYETTYEKQENLQEASQKKFDLASFRIPLEDAFEREGEWSINQYFSCQEGVDLSLQSKLYIQVRFSLPPITNISLLEGSFEESIKETQILGDLKLTETLNGKHVGIQGSNINKINSNNSSNINKNSLSIMADVDLNKEDERHAKLISQLILSMGQQEQGVFGSLKLIVVKAKHLIDVQDPQRKIASPVVEYTLNLDQKYSNYIKDSHPNVVEEPVWFHTNSQDISSQIPLAHASLALHLFDEIQPSEKSLLGSLNIDLHHVISQPCKWLINGYYDLVNAGKHAGQIFIQSKFIPAGLEYLHQEMFGPLLNLD